MALIRYQPFRELDNLQKEMNRLFDNLVSANEGVSPYAFVPSAEMEESGEAIHLRLELPGIDPKELDVQVTANSVSITGERRSETKTTEDGVTRSEFRYGRFQRVIPLPARVQNNQTTAEYKDGILHLTLPKAEEEKNKVFKVTL
ncbi:MAG: molecular chaperone [Cyanobacteria bacterium M5B4]|nr:Hsp20/alpha crystallin family protein [Cyanobacteria bacterium KgW148]PLS69662.1 MAG: molecular chaperone [Cyanobacteria bacterium M5B4]